MAEHVIKCPECGAPLVASRFARQVDCRFCKARVNVDPSVVSASRYHAAHRAWTTPDRVRYPEVWRLAGHAWAPIARLAEGDRFTIYIADEARSPTQRVAVRVAKSANDAAALERAWAEIAALRGRDGFASVQIAALLPHQIARGALDGGRHGGSFAVLSPLRSTFRHSLADVRRSFPRGVDPHVAMWIWRRILDATSYLHRAGVAHGAIVPAHVLVEDNDHGATLVGWSRMTRIGEQRPKLPPGHDAFEADLPERASAELDVILSARTISFALGGDGGAQVPAHVPRPFAEVLARIATGKLGPEDGDAQKLYASLRKVARAALGPPAFHPLRMPD